MPTRAQEVLAKALQLPLRARARVLAELIASLDGEPDPEADAAWAEEIERRARRAISGKSGGRDWSTVRDRLRKNKQR
jgi:hypothetical protein